MKKFLIALLVVLFIGITTPASTGAAAKSLTVDCYVVGNGSPAPTEENPNPEPYPSDAYCNQVGADDYAVGVQNLGTRAGVYTVNNVGAKNLRVFTALRYKPIGPVDTVNENCQSDRPCASWTSPYLQIPVDLDGDQRGSGSQDAVLMIPAHSCMNSAGVVDVINDATCTVWSQGNAFANWSAYLASAPTAAVSKFSGAPMIGVDHAYGEGDWILQDVQFTTG